MCKERRSNANRSFTSDLKNNGNNVSQCKLENTDVTCCMDRRNVNVARHSEEQYDKRHAISIGRQLISVFNTRQHISALDTPGLSEEHIKDDFNFLALRTEIQNNICIVGPCLLSVRGSIQDHRGLDQVTQISGQDEVFYIGNEDGLYVEYFNDVVKHNGNVQLHSYEDSRVKIHHHDHQTTQEKELQQRFLTKAFVSEEMKHKKPLLKGFQKMRIEGSLVDFTYNITAEVEGMESPASLHSVFKRTTQHPQPPAHKQQYKLKKPRTMRKEKTKEYPRTHYVSDSSSSNEQTLYRGGGATTFESCRESHQCYNGLTENLTTAIFNSSSS